MKITFVCSSLQPGGAERVLAVMANHWARHGREISVITLEPCEATPFYRLDSRIDYRRLDLTGASRSLPGAVWNNMKRIAAIRRSIKDAAPDAVISFLSETNVITLMAVTGLGVPVYVTEHTDPKLWPIAPLWDRLRRVLYPRAARIVVLNRYIREFFARHGRVVVLPNPVESKGSDAMAGPRRNRVTAMGRLVPEKGFDTLIRAFASLEGEGRSWCLEIIGEGPERRHLEELAGKLGVADRVALVGLTPEPEHFLRRAGVFVLSSRIEGFPMSLCEAMACGTPVVSTIYHDGVHDLVVSGINGLLVPPGDPEALAKAVKTFIDDPSLRRRLGDEAARITETYGVEQVMRQWDDLLGGSGA